MWNSFVAILLKEFTHILRDRATLGISMMIPLFQLVLFGFIDQTVRDLPTVVVDQDQSRESRVLIDELRATRTFKVTHVTPNPHDAREDITAGRARVGVVIPPDFHDKRARHLAAKVLVLIDGSDSTASAQALAAANGIAAQVTVEEINAATGGSGAEPPAAGFSVLAQRIRRIDRFADAAARSLLRGLLCAWLLLLLLARHRARA